MPANETIAQRARRLYATTLGPFELAQAVLAEIDCDRHVMRAALKEVLPSFCRVVIGNERRKNFKTNTADELDEELLDITDPAPLPEGSAPPAEKVWVSKKSERISTAYTELLASQFHVAPGLNGNRHLGDCTVENLAFAANERRQQAHGHITEAKRLEALADAIRRYSATRVADLPAQIVIDIMDRKRAA